MIPHDLVPKAHFHLEVMDHLETHCYYHTRLGHSITWNFLQCILIWSKALLPLFNHRVPLQAWSVTYSHIAFLRQSQPGLFFPNGLCAELPVCLSLSWSLLWSSYKSWCYRFLKSRYWKLGGASTKISLKQCNGPRKSMINKKTQNC